MGEFLPENLRSAAPGHLSGFLQSTAVPIGMAYLITAPLPLAGTTEGLTYLLAIAPSPCGSGFVLNLEVARFGGPDKIGIVEARTEEDLSRRIHQVGFDASGLPQLALDQLVERKQAQKR